MDAVFTVADVVNICSAFMVISGVVTIFIKAYKTAKEPEKNLAVRVDKLEKKTESYEEFFNRDNKEIDDLKEGNRITQRAMLALLKHAKNGNDVDSIDKAEKDLEEYLINKNNQGVFYD